MIFFLCNSSLFYLVLLFSAFLNKPKHYVGKIIMSHNVAALYSIWPCWGAALSLKSRGMKNQFVKSSFVIQRYKSKGKDYAYVRVRFGTLIGGRTKWTSFYPLYHLGTKNPITPPLTAKNFSDLPNDLQNLCWQIATQYHQDTINKDINLRMPSAYKTCEEAMDAYLDWSIKNDGDKTQRSKAKTFKKYFGGKKLSAITKTTAQAFLDWAIDSGGDDGQPIAYDTIRHRIAVSSQMISWLAEREQWIGDNPFAGILTRYRRILPERKAQKKTVTETEYEKLWIVSQDDRFKAVRQYLYISHCVGLRNEEIFRMDTSDIDRSAQQWNLLAKKGGRRFRRISIPRCLITFIDNEGISGKLKFPGLDNLYPEARRLAGLSEDLKMKTVRKDFSNRMRSAGASNDLIRFHQGRQRSDVTNRDYLDEDESLKMTAEIIAKIFGENISSLKLVTPS